MKTSFTLLLAATLTMGNTWAGYHAAAVPLLLSPANDPFVQSNELKPQGFVRIVNQSDEFGNVRIIAVDDAGNRAAPVNLQLHANAATHFNTKDLEEGNDRKGIDEGVGRPAKGHWRLDVETELDVRVLSYVRALDGFLTAMHDVLPRDDQDRLAVQFLNPGRNHYSQSRLRLINTGEDAETITIEGFDDKGNKGKRGHLVTVTLAAGEACTLTAHDIEVGIEMDHLDCSGAGFVGFGVKGGGKWHLFITAGPSIVGQSLMFRHTTGVGAAHGHITNLSTQGATP